jgi:putative phosphoesterase
MIHGDHRSKPTEQYAFDAFADQRVDAIVFGHSHRPVIKERAGIALINPGSPTDKRFNPLYSYAILEVADGKVEACLHYYLSRATGR